MADDKLKPEVGIVDSRSNTARQGNIAIPVAPGPASTTQHGEARKEPDKPYVPTYNQKDSGESLGDAAARVKAEKAKAAAANTTASKVSPDKPSYKHGADYVPKTGPAKLHKGEAVLSKPDADKYRVYGLAAGHMGGEQREEKPLKKVKEVRIRKGKSGGHIVEHHHTHPEHHPMEEHVMPDMNALHSHLDQNIGPESDAQAAPPGAGAPPPGGMAGAVAAPPTGE